MEGLISRLGEQTHTELLLEEVVSYPLSREAQVECCHFSNLSDWMQSSLPAQTPFGKSSMLDQYQR